MSFFIQKVSDYGTETPAVARCVPQASNLLNATKLSAKRREEVLGVILELQRHLLRCLAERKEVESGVVAGRAQMSEKGIGKAPAYSLPGVPDLKGRCESFLHSARLALHQCGRLVAVGLRDEFDDVPDTGHRFDKLLPWCERTLGADHVLSEMVKNIEPWAAIVVQMRNAVDHPKEGDGNALHVLNFRLGTEANTVVDPGWLLTGSPPQSILESMAAIETGLLEVYEELFIGVFECIKATPHIQMVEVPEQKRDPKCPIRFEMALAPSLRKQIEAKAVPGPTSTG